MPCSSALFGTYGIRGFFVSSKHASEVPMPEFLGDTIFFFSCLGTSSLSRILEVFWSRCLLLSNGDRTGLSNFALDICVGECVVGSSVTNKFSHSSVMHAEFSLTLSNSRIFFSVASCTGFATSDSCKIKFDSVPIFKGIALMQWHTC